MTAYALGRQLRPEVGGLRGLTALVLVAAWTVLAADILIDAIPGGFAYPSGAVYAVLAFPLAVVVAAIVSRGDAAPAVRLGAAWATAVSAALAAAVVVDDIPQLALVVPVLLVSAVVCTRWPAGALIAMLGVTGFTNTLHAYTSIPTDELVDLILVGLWGGVAWSYLFNVRERPVWVWPGIALCMVYIALTLGAIAGAESFMGGLRAFRSTAWYMLAFLLIAYAGWDRRTHHNLAKGFVVVATLVGGYATFRWLGGQSGKETALALAGNGRYEVVDDEVRLFGSFSSGHELAAWTAVFIPFCLAFALTFKGRWAIPALAGTVLCTVGLLGSEARAGFVGAVLGVALVLLLYQLARGVPGLHLGITAAAVIGVLGMGAFVFGQTAGDSESGTGRYTRLITDPTDDPSYEARIFKWSTAFETIWDNPLGQGLGAGGVRSSRYVGIGSSSIDSSYLKVALEQGFGVMVLFIAGLVLLLFGLARRAVFTLDRHKAGLGMGAAGALTALAALMFSEVAIIGLTALAAWMLIGLGVSQFTGPSSAPGDSSA